MARTLTAGATTWKAGPTYQYNWLVESEALNIRWAFATTTAGGYTWEKRLLAISEIEISAPLVGGISSVNTVTIAVIESDTGNSVRNLWNQYGFLEGADLTVSLLPAGEAYADRIKLFTGQIDHAQWLTGVAEGAGVAQVLAVSKDLPANVFIPSRPLTREDYPNLAPQAEGQFLPIVYAQPTYGVQWAPLHLVDTTTWTYRAAGHPVDSMTSWHAVASGATIFPKLADAIATAGGAELRLLYPITAQNYYVGSSTPFLSATTGVTNPTQALDSDYNTVATITPSAVDAIGEGYGILGVGVTWPVDTSGINTITVNLGLIKRIDPLAVTSTARLIAHAIDATSHARLQQGIATDGPYSWGANARAVSFTFGGVTVGGSVGVEIELYVTNEGGAGGTSQAWTLSEVTIFGKYQPTDDFQQVYAYQVGGKEDGDGHITGVTGGPLYQVGAVVQDILEAYLGLSVETTSFTAAKALTAWNGGAYQFGFGIGGGWLNPQLSGNALLDALGYQSHSFIFPSGSGTFKMTAIAHDPSSLYAFTVSNSDHVRVESSRMEAVFHTYLVRYAWSPITQQFTKVARVGPDGGNHYNLAINTDLTIRCADSFARYGVLPPLQVDAWAIQDQTTAETLLESLVLTHWTQNFLVTLDTSFVALHLEIGDGATITHPELPTSVNGAVFTLLRVTLRPEEAGSRPWPIEIQARAEVVTYFTYFAIKDQNAVVWYWWVTMSGDLEWSTTVPSVPIRTAADLALSPTPSWLVLTDPAAATRYVYPAVDTGEPRVETSAPSVGSGYAGSPTVRGLNRQNYTLSVSLAQEVQIDLA